MIRAGLIEPCTATLRSVGPIGSLLGGVDERFGGDRTSGEPAGADRGGATVLSAVLCVAVLGVVWLGLQVGAAALARYRAGDAADLAALAAAVRAPHGPDVACGQADQVVREAGAQLTSCALDGWDARVTVRAGSPVLLGPLAANARARAGPVESERPGHPASPDGGDQRE